MALPLAGIGLGALNAVPDAELEPALLACCSSPAWVGAMLAGRPYRGVAEVLEASDVALAAMTESDVDSALEGHPQIGEPLTAVSAESSRREQAGIVDAEDSVRRGLAEGNRDYERRFGHLYLVSAAGRSAGELLELLGERLANDPATERAVLRQELAKINRLRLERLLGVMTTVSTHVLDAVLGRPAAGVPVRLERAPSVGQPGDTVVEASTDIDGRLRLDRTPLTAGVYSLVFDTGTYFSATGREAFYPEVSVTFRVRESGQRYHVPLLLSPFGYSTYRGS